MSSCGKHKAYRSGLRRSARGIVRSVAKTPTQLPQFLTIPRGTQDSDYHLRLPLTLDLEIRNAIYDRCLEASQRKLTPRGSKLRPHSARGCLALMQVCRQLQNEIRPLYFRRGVSVRLCQVTSLIDSFFPSMLDSQAPTRISIDISRSAGMRPIDIKPVLQACITQDAIHFSFYSKGLGRRLPRKLTKSLHCQPKAWQEMIQGYADRVYLQPPEKMLAIVFYPGRFQDWITKRNINAEEFWTDLGFGTRTRGSVRLEVLNIDCFFTGSSSRRWFLCGLQAPFMVTQPEMLRRHRYEESESGSCCPCIWKA